MSRYLYVIVITLAQLILAAILYFAAFILCELLFPRLNEEICVALSTLNTYVAILLVYRGVENSLRKNKKDELLYGWKYSIIVVSVLLISILGISIYAYIG